MQFAATSDAPARARAALDASLGDDPRAASAALATSELVTNALLHADLSERQSIELRLSEHGDRLRVEVLNDTAAGYSAADVVDRRHGAAEHDDEVGGWGLGLVDALSVSWGVGSDGRRTLVWFEV